MGNCQAADTATLVIQHPNGKVDRLYWAVAASEIMKMNPGHYVALLISTTLCPSKNNNEKAQNDKNGNNNMSQVRLTRIKLLRPTDTLVLGQVYRLITTQEVRKGLKNKKQAKMKNYQLEAAEKHEKMHGKHGLGGELAERRHETEENQMNKAERQRQRMAGPRTWQPSLKSISEAPLAP